MFTDTFTLKKKFLACEQQAAGIAHKICTPQGFSLWPAIKMAFAVDCGSSTKKYLSNTFTPRQACRTKAFTFPDWVFAELHRLPPKSCFIFSVAALHVEQVAGKAYDPYLDPVYYEAQEVGLNPVKIVLASQPLKETLVPALEIPLATKGEHSIPAADLPYIPGYDAAVELFLANGCPIINPIRVWDMYFFIESYAKLFVTLLQRIAPALVVLQEYYTPSAMGLSWACRQLGIPCIEYQHGMQAWPHFFYTFPHMPERGFDIMPQWFFTWGEKPAQDLKQQFAGQHFHQVAVTGKPNYIAWKKGCTPEDPVALQAFEKRLAGHQPICVPLPLDYATDAELGYLREAIAAGPPEWLWLFRCHPVFPCRKSQSIIEKFSDRIETELTSSLRLHTVLSRCKHMVYEFSSACHEAVSLHAMRATCFSATAAETYKRSFNNTDFYFAHDAASLMRSVREGIAAYPSKEYAPTYMTQNTDLLKAALLRLAKGKPPLL